ncbi:hypothetical protein [Rhizobium leguminosarum]|uniref:hypothetical protein n=1 Tax=Rhizobium leguminosarum TaxID=384 RepID=UPI0018123004|nr:hypothetical protein [Rhizobium leguminosarum]MBB4506812.1 ABC-type proline/glycine betaine transport system ATPase subunit [Rhizobium leguminosarum]
MRDDRLLQYDTPQEILARPVNEFVESFLGPDRAIKRLSLIAVSMIMTAPEPGNGDAEIAADATVHDALALILSSEMPGLHVRAADGTLAGYLSRDTLLRANRL